MLDHISTATGVGTARRTLLRTVSYNVRACRGYPDSRAVALFPDNRHRRIAECMAAELARYELDIVTLQEAPAEAEVEAMASGLGMKYAYFDGGYPGALLTRHGIEAVQNAPWSRGAEGELFTRHAGSALLRVHGESVEVVSVHLHPADVAVRAREVAVLVDALAGRPDAARALLVQGDFNHDPLAPEHELWKQAGLVDAFVPKGNRARATKPSSAPTVRLDYVLAGGALRQRLLDCRVLFEGKFRASSAGSMAFALSDHLPVLASFEE
jgi:endonuclease/exonuclease/phosphatase family metal-dependent hydrolase